jgi:hypothetical protein
MIVVLLKNKIMKMINQPILFLLMILFTNCRQKTEKEIYFLPYGFTGRVVVFFNQSEGESMKHDHDFRVYEIPKNGILKSQFNVNGGLFKDVNNEQKFYWRDNATGKIARLLVNESEFVDSNTFQIFWYKTGITYPIVETQEKSDSGVERKITKTSEEGTRYIQFYVDRFSNRNKYNFKTGFDEQAAWEQVLNQASIKKSLNK